MVVYALDCQSRSRKFDPRSVETFPRSRHHMAYLLGAEFTHLTCYDSVYNYMALVKTVLAV